MGANEGEIFKKMRKIKSKAGITRSKSGGGDEAGESMTETQR